MLERAACNAIDPTACSAGTEHYGFTFTVQEGIDAISDVREASAAIVVASLAPPQAQSDWPDWSA